MDRTLRFPLKPTNEQKEILLETMREFTQSFNFVCAQGWRRREGNAFTLHKITYRDCKTANPDLVSDLHIQARQKAAEALKSAISLEKKGRKVGCPASTLCPPRFNIHTFKLDRVSGTVNLATVVGRQRIAFIVPPYVADWLPDNPPTAKTATADLLYRHGHFTLHVVFHMPDVEFVDTGQALGVDLGICRPAVTSDNRFHGKRRWREVSKRRFRVKRKLQSNGSKSAKRHLRRLAGREQRFRRDCDHVLSKSILDRITTGTTVVIENLTNIRTRVKATKGDAKRRLHAWSFAQLASFLTYKAQQQGCQVAGVDPRHTSQRCSRCGFIYRGNRPSQSRFHCRSCGFQLNADLNASRSIRDKHLVGWAKSSSDAAPSEVVSSQSCLRPIA